MTNGEKTKQRSLFVMAIPQHKFFLMNLYLKKSLKTKESRQMDSDFYKNENDKTVDLMIE